MPLRGSLTSFRTQACQFCCLNASLCWLRIPAVAGKECDQFSNYRCFVFARKSEVKLEENSYIKYTVLDIVTSQFFDRFEPRFKLYCVFAHLSFNVSEHLIGDGKNVFFHYVLECVKLLVVDQFLE